MRQFMGEQLLAGRTVGCELALGEHNVAANRIGQGTNVPRRRGSLGIQVHAHATEIVPEAGLHKRARRRV
jgi:hypothetical protein